MTFVYCNSTILPSWRDCRGSSIKEYICCIWPSEFLSTLLYHLYLPLLHTCRLLQNKYTQSTSHNCIASENQLTTHEIVIFDGISDRRIFECMAYDRNHRIYRIVVHLLLPYSKHRGVLKNTFVFDCHICIVI